MTGQAAMRGAVIVALALGGPRMLPAQVLVPALFPEHPTVVDLARYATPEQCFAAVERVQDSVVWGHRTERLPLTLAPEASVGRQASAGTAERQVPLAAGPYAVEAPIVRETARRCGVRFQAATADSADLPLLRDLFLHAGWDDQAYAALTRQLALLPPSTPPAARARALTEAIRFALQEARPARIAGAESLLVEINRGGWETRLDRISVFDWLQQIAGAGFDTVRVVRYSSAILALVDSLPGDERFLLRVKGAEGYARRAQVMLAVMRGAPVEPLERAEPLAGSYWFGRADEKSSRPTRGRVALVAFVNAECGSPCHDAYGTLRRLAQRFGDSLEITLATRTHGHFRAHPPLAPADEAELLREYFQEYNQLPGALVVETTPFTHLPAPDGRRVDQQTANVINYEPQSEERGFGLRTLARSVSAFLVDRDGQVLMQFPLVAPGHERMQLATIAGLIARSPAAGAAPDPGASR